MPAYRFLLYALWNWIVLGLLVLFPLGRALAGVVGLPVSASGAIPLVDPIAAVIAVILPCVIIPMAEELLFRGFLLGLPAAKIQNPMQAGLIGMIMFGLMHIGFYRFVCSPSSANAILRGRSACGMIWTSRA